MGLCYSFSCRTTCSKLTAKTGSTIHITSLSNSIPLNFFLKKRAIFTWKIWEFGFQNNVLGSDLTSADVTGKIDKVPFSGIVCAGVTKIMWHSRSLRHCAPS